MHFKYCTIDDDEAQYTPSTFSPVKLTTILTLANVRSRKSKPQHKYVCNFWRYIYKFDRRKLFECIQD